MASEGGEVAPAAKGEEGSKQAGTNFNYLLEEFGTATSCSPCAVGYAQDLTGQASCLPCIPGRYNDLTGQTVCPPCAKNTISSEPASTSCVSCGVGEFAEEGSARSQRCNQVEITLNYPMSLE